MSPTPDPFRPAWWLPGAHLQSIAPSVWPARGPVARCERHIVPVASGSAVLLEVDRPRGASVGTVLLIHGMCGSSRSGYMLRTARIALARDWSVARMNLRTCGGTERLARTFYNAGQSADVGRVLAFLDEHRFTRPLVAAGFSLGGNLVLLHAGRAAAASLADAVAAINPPVDLARCARALDEPRNRAYRYHFTSRLCRHQRRVSRLRGDRGPRAAWWRCRTLQAFDDAFTAPDAGFAGAAEYYAASSSAPLLGRVVRPGLVISARDDPFVPVEMFEPHHAAAAIRFAHPRSGGHCGYVRQRTPRYWAGDAVIRFFEAATGRAAAASPAADRSTE